MRKLTEISSECGAKVIVTCSDYGVDPSQVSLAKLIWKHCGVVRVYQTETEDIIIEDGEVVRIVFHIPYADLSNINDFELIVFADGVETLISRGRIFLMVAVRQDTVVTPEPPPPDANEEWIIGEAPNGPINGSNATFVTDFPFIPESLMVYVNGLQQSRPDDFNTTGTQTIILTFSLEVGEEIAVTYMKA